MVRRWLVVCAVAAAGAAGLSSPAAWADDIYVDNAVGTYDYLFRDDLLNTWVVTPCDDGAPKCVQVRSYSLKDTAEEVWGGRAYWTVGSWIMVVVRPAIKCDDGVRHDAKVTYSWDAVSNTGWRSYLDPGICEDKPDSHAGRITLIKRGPPPPPAEPQPVP